MPQPTDTPVLRTRDIAAGTAFAIRLAWDADRRRLLEIVAAQLCAASGLVVVVLVIRRLFGTAVMPGSGGGVHSEGLILTVGVLLAVGSFGAVMRNISSARNRVLAVEVDRHVIAMVLEAATRAELARFEEPEFHDRLQRAVFASRSQPVVVVTMLVAALQGFLAIIAVGSAFLVMAWWLLPFAIATAIPVLRSARAERNAGYGLHRDLAEDRRMRQYIEHLLTGRDEAKEVRSLELGPVLRARWHAEYAREVDDTADWQRRYLRTKNLARLSADAATVAVIAGVWWLIGTDLITLPTAAAAVTGLWLLSSRVQLIGGLMNGLGDSILYLKDLRSFTADRPAARAADDGSPARPRPAVPPHREGVFASLRAESVGFSYPGDTPVRVLDDVSITLDKGEFVAVVGVNGSGKTTLAKILAGLYAPDSGRVLFNGQEVSDPEALRDAVAPVFQDFVRYKFPAADGIAFGRAGAAADSARVRAAAEQAGAHAFLDRLPDGYETVLSKEFRNGTDLSLGQWQRLALARAFYRDAPFLILDEPTASLDPQAEMDLHDHLRRLFADRTVLLISHRFSTVRNADRIYVMDRGRVIEEGTHDALIARDGTYARLFRIQASGFLDSAPSAVSVPGSALIGRSGRT